MTNLCAVIGCDSVKRRHAYEDDSCTPLNFFKMKTACPETLQAWLRVCGTDLTPENCKSRLICSKHFLPSEIFGNRHIRANLKIGAIPSRNILLPQHFEIVDIEEVARDSDCSERMSCQDIHPIKNIQEILPSWHCESENTTGDIWYFQVLISSKNSPDVAKSVKVFRNGSLPQFRIGENLLSKNQTEIIIGNLNCYIEDEFISVLKEFSNIPPPKVDRATSVINTITCMLKGKCAFNDYADEQDVEMSDSDNSQLFLSFIVEQLKMFCMRPQARKWSSSILTWALAVHFNSPSAYRSLCHSGYIILPTERTLRRYMATDATRLAVVNEV